MLGGVAWGIAWLVSPSRTGANSQVEIWASGVFQLGLFALLAVMWATAATGSGRVARGILAAEVVALVLAIVDIALFWASERAGTAVMSVYLIVRAGSRAWP